MIVHIIPFLDDNMISVRRWQATVAGVTMFEPMLPFRNQRCTSRATMYFHFRILMRALKRNRPPIRVTHPFVSTMRTHIIFKPDKNKNSLGKETKEQKEKLYQHK
jgi:hypothetical protein